MRLDVGDDWISTILWYIMKVNRQTIPGHGNSAAVHDYAFLDVDAPDGVVVRYFLEDIDFAVGRERIETITALLAHGVRATTWGRLKTRRSACVASQHQP